MAKVTKHELASIALGYARCSCSWEFRVQFYRNKTDEDLAAETGEAFTQHQKKSDSNT